MFPLAPRAPKRLLTTAAALALTAAAAPGVASAAITPLKADLESGDFTQFTQTNVANGTLTNGTDRAYDGTRSAHATFAGGANGYSRGVEYVNWNDGDDVWYGSAFYLPTGFKAAMQGEVSLMRWDNWPTYGGSGDVGGISIWGSDKRARLKAGTYGTESPLVGPFDLPEGRWFWLEVHQKLSSTSGTALSEVYLDGQKIGSSTAANSAGRTIERVRYGLVAEAGSTQTNPLDLWFDRSAVSTSQIGPVSSGSGTTSSSGSTGTSSSGSTGTPASGSTASADTTPPTAKITSPYEGQPFGNGLGIHVDASDNVGVAKVLFYLDGNLVGTRTGSPWVVSLDTTNLPLGTHTIDVKAYDKAGNVGSSHMTVKRVKSSA